MSVLQQNLSGNLSSLGKSLKHRGSSQYLPRFVEPQIQYLCRCSTFVFHHIHFRSLFKSFALFRLSHEYFIEIKAKLESILPLTFRLRDCLVKEENHVLKSMIVNKHKNVSISVIPIITATLQRLYEKSNDTQEYSDSFSLMSFGVKVTETVFWCM